MMNQVIAVNWLVFGLSLAVALLFGVFYALIVRLMSLWKVEGQTANMVVVGVGAVLLLGTAVIGLADILVLFALFIAAGLPMVIEYGNRIHTQRRKDIEAALAISKEALNDDNEASTFVLLVIMLIVTFVIVWLFLALAFLAAIAGVG